MEVLPPHVILTQLFCILLELSNAEIKTVGNALVPGQSWKSASPSMWVDLATRIPPAVAIRWRLYSSVGHRPVRLQVWRPLVGSDEFLLVAEHRVVPTSIGLHENTASSDCAQDQYDLPVDERVTVKETDKLGFTNEMAEGPVAYSDSTWRDVGRHTGGADVGVTWAEVSMMPQVGSIYRMSHLEPERRYSLNLDVVTCAPPWSIVDVHCVQFIQSVSNWSQGGSHCEALGGHLVTPRAWTFASSLRRAMVLQGMTQTWLGLSYNETTSYFTWMDHVGGEIYSGVPSPPVGMHQRAHGDAAPSHQLCVALTQLGHWATLNCSHRTPFICQNNRGQGTELSTDAITASPSTRTTPTTRSSTTPTTTTTTATTTATTTTTTTTTYSTTLHSPVSPTPTPSSVTPTSQVTKSTTAPSTAVFTEAPAAPPTRLGRLHLLMTSPTTTVQKDGCGDVTTWTRGQACLQPSDRLLLGQALGENRSIEADVILMDTVTRKVGGSSPVGRHRVTVLDLILLTRLLDALLGEDSFLRQASSIQPGLTAIFVRSLADVTDTVLSSTCNCSDAWRNMTKLQEGPLDTVRRMEALMHNALRHVTKRPEAMSLDVKRNGLDIHMETVLRRNISFYRHHMKEDDIEITIPKTFFLNSTDQLGVSVVVVKHADQLVGFGLNNRPDNATLNSKVVSLMIHPPHDASSDTWIAIRVPHFRPINRTFQTPICVYWDYRGTEGWATDGCRVSHFHENATVCECNHLTNFAVLMQSFDFEMTAADRRALSVVTYAGCSLSVFGLLATLITHLVCRCFSERGRILINLCLALLAAYILFIFGIDRANDKRVCKLVAAGLHYFYLSAFFWMLAQGIELYSKLRIVFMQRSKIVHYSLLGWGLPGLIVAVALLMRFDDYGRDEYCWLSMQTGLIWSFIGPVVVVVLANFCVLCFVLNTFSQPRLGKESGFRRPKSKSRRSAARAALILLPVLGLTWILGLLSVNEHTVMFQYLFAVCNSSQGFLIFILHCVLNEEVRASWRRHVKTRKRLDSFRSDVKSVSTNNTGFSRTSACRAPGTPPPALEHGFPRSILRPTCSSASSATSASKLSACPQSSIMSDSSLDSSSVMSDGWDNRKRRVRMLGLSYLLPGRSKSVVITDPKTAKRRVKEREAAAQACVTSSAGRI